MSDGTRALETDPSVCYRHPGRQSWVLCQRCGRTVCPECQIMAPVGVHCPECVAETSGGVRWQPTNVAPLKPKRRRAARSAGRVRTLLAPSGTGLDAARTVLIAAVVLFVVGCFTSLPAQLLAAIPSSYGVPFGELQLWRYVTAPLISSSGGFSLQVLLSFGLSAVFYALTAPQVERAIGRSRFLGVTVVSSVIGNAATVLAGGVGSGLTPVLFGCFAALLVEVWHDQRLRVQILVMIGINLLLTLALGGGGLTLLVGGLIGGAGTLWLLRTGPDRGWKPRTPALIVGAVCVGLVLLAALRGGLLG